ncbi:MAG: hypothetical protein WC861_05860 [Candidatus Micrarchaeia archaeon]|jgi:hypothetical protein
MALKLVDGKEMRVPGGAIPEGQRRQGALGKLDGMSLSEFRKMPLANREGLLLEAKGSGLFGAKDLASAKCIVIYRDNSFYTSILDLVKEKLGNNVEFLAIPKETNDFSEPLLKYIKSVLDYAKEHGITVLMDNTVQSGGRTFQYETPVAWGNMRWVKSIDSFLWDNNLSDDSSASFKRTLVQIGQEEATAYRTISTILVVLGKVDYDGTIRSTLNTHGITVEIEGKEVKIGPYDTLGDKKIRDGMYHFIKSSLLQGGLRSVYPAFIIKGKLAVMLDYEKIRMDGKQLYGTGGKENACFRINNWTYLADRHVSEEDISASMPGFYPQIYHLHGGHAAEKLNVGPYDEKNRFIYGGDPRAETDTAKLVERIAKKIEEAISKA